MGGRALPAATLAVLVVSAAGCTAGSPPSEPSGDSPVAQADFDGDGYADFAAGATRAKDGRKLYTGFVAVVYGSASGVKSARKQLITQDSPGIPGTFEPQDEFGASLATGDLDRDGYTDLVVGAPGEGTGSLLGAGAMTVLWGGAKGLSGGTVIKGTKFEGLGADVVTGDFDGNGHSDVATKTTIAYGPFTREGGPARTAANMLRQLPAEKGSGDGDEDAPRWTTYRLAAGDLDGDGITDLAAGVEQSGEDGEDGPRYLTYQLGSASGLSKPRFVESSAGARLPGGHTVAIGDLDNDGYGDLVFGRSGATGRGIPGPATGIGLVRGSASGPDGSGVTYIRRDTAGLPRTPEQPDDFGGALSLGDVDDDGHLDLAVGIAGEEIGPHRDAGAVAVLKGSASGPSGKHARVFTRNTAGVPGAPEAYDQFGAAVALVDTDKDGRSDLVVGAPGNGRYEDGGLWVLRGTSSGISASGTCAFDRHTFGITTPGVQLGASLSAP
jgi:hypothetical protein